MCNTVASERGGEGFVESTLGMLQDVLQYELACAERYRRFVSLVMVREGTSGGRVGPYLADRVRSSDLIAEKSSSVFILMSETDKSGAKLAIDRFKKRDHGKTHDLRFALVTYPYDSGGAANLLETAERRLEMAAGQGPGTVVAAD